MTDSGVWFGLLGPVELRLAGAQVPIRSARARALLAALLCRPNVLLSADELIDLVWGERAPSGAATTLRSHVMRVRRLLEDSADRVETMAAGYRIHVDLSTELDWAIFEERCLSGRAAARRGDWPAVTQDVSEALALWRGTPLSDVDSERLRRDEQPALIEARVAAVELLTRAALEQGRADEAISALRGVAGENPHREQTHALLMSALAADGRRAEALEVYRRLRGDLVRELGIEPGAELKELQREILSAERGAGAATAGASAKTPVPARPRPQSLPRDTADFTGRDAELREVLAALRVEPDDGAARVVVIDGMGGVGKSALALHAAHVVAKDYDDGRLYADLRGTSPHPVEPSAVLGSFLHLLGVPSAEMPVGPTARAAHFRSLLADRRVLILLDDAGDAAQIGPLLPASPGCAVVVTVRHKLLDLPGCRRVSLEGLSREASHAFLDRIVGEERVRAEPEAAGAVLEACANLPLAIRVAGGRLAARPNWRVEDLSARLELAHRRLAELEFAEYSVRASFEIGYSGLIESGGVSAEAAEAFRLLGLWSGADLGLGAIASLISRTPEQAEGLMEHLLDVNMVLSPRSGRYVLHDLLREFASGRARDEVGPEERREAAARLVSWYAESSAEMEQVLRAVSRSDAVSSHEGVVAVHVPKDQADAVDWGEREHANLIEAVRLGTQYALPDLARRLSRATWTFFNQQQHFESWITTNELALTAVREHGDAEAEAAVSNNLATALAASGRPEEALVHLERCAEIRRAQGDVQRLGGILSNMGIAAMQAGRPDQAQAHFQEALTLPTTIEFRATAHANLGHFHLLLGHHEDSIAQSLASAELCRRRPEPDVDLGTVLGNLADAYRGLGDLSEAALHAREAVAVMRTISSRPGLIENLERLASILEKAGGDAEQREAADLRAEAATLAPPT